MPHSRELDGACVFDLDGKVIVVTGAAAGIGAAIASRCAAAGAVAIGLDINPFDDAERAVLADAHHVDVAREDEVRTVVDVVAQKHGRIDAVVNNAGVSVSDRDIMDDSDASYLRAFRVNVLGSMHVLRATVPAMPAGSAVVNIASLSAFLGIARMGAYAASKAALVELTRTAAVELAPNGIRVNAIAPSAVDTDMLSGDSPLVVAERAWANQATPAARLIRPDEVAAMTHYLVSDEAAMVNGQCLIMDGGASAGPALSILNLAVLADDAGAP